MVEVYNKMGKRVSLLFLSILVLSAIGASISIGQYGLYLPLMAIMVIYYVYNLLGHKDSQLPYNLIILYIVYIVIFFFCSLFNGDGDSGRNSLLIGYSVCIIVYLLIGQLVRTRRDIEAIIKIFCVVLILNCIVTITQYYNIALGWWCWHFLNSAKAITQDVVSNMKESGQQIGNGLVFCPGIFPSQVYNGYFVCSLGCLYLIRLNKYKTVVGDISYLLGLLLISYTIFIVQQRTAFFVFIGVASIIYFNRYKLTTLLLAFLAIVFFLMYDFDFSAVNLGRYSEVHDNLRGQIYETGYEYVLEHFIIGGRTGFYTINNTSGHNIILNAFLYGGGGRGVMYYINIPKNVYKIYSRCL